MMFIRHFTKEDWYCFAGALPFDDGFDPFISEFKLKDDTEVTILSHQDGYELLLPLNEIYVFGVKVPFFDSVMAEKILIDLIEEFKLAADKTCLVTSLIREGWERFS